MEEFTVEWYDEEQSIVLWIYPKRYELEQLLASGTRVGQMIRATPSQRIDVIMLINREEAPTGNLVSILTQMYETLSPKIKSVCYIGPSSFSKIVINILKNTNETARKTTRFATTLEEAVGIIEALREADTPKS